MSRICNTVDVLKYRPGLEDGLECMSYNDRCSEASANCFRNCYMCKQQGYSLRRAYILTEQGKQYIHDGDCIIIDELGKKGVASPEVVGAMYQVVV